MWFAVWSQINRIFSWWNQIFLMKFNQTRDRNRFICLYFIILNFDVCLSLWKMNVYTLFYRLTVVRGVDPLGSLPPLNIMIYVSRFIDHIHRYILCMYARNNVSWPLIHKRIMHKKNYITDLKAIHAFKILWIVQEVISFIPLRFF